MIKMSRVIVSIVFGVSVFLCFMSYYSHQSEAMVISQRSAYILHRGVVKNFKCHHPRRRSVPISSDLFVGLRGDETISPSMTVLHRCDAGSGCCEEEYTCAPVENTIEEVNLVFQILNVGLGTERYQTITAKNHTHCKCQPIRDLPK